MKKITKHLVLALAILCMGGITTSCDSDTIAQIISQFFNTGETYTFSGTAASRLYTGSYKTAKWDEMNAYEYGLTTMLECANDLGTLTIQAMSTQGISQIAITNLTLTPNADQTYTVLANSQTSQISGSVTIDNVTYTAAAWELVTAAATPSEMALELIVYFQGTGDSSDYSKKLLLTFTGATATE